MSSPPPQEFGRREEEKEEIPPQEETEDDPQPGGDPPTGVIPKRKRRRLDMKKVDQSKIVDIQSLPANPLLEVPFLKQTTLQVKVFVGNKVYVANTGDADVSIPVGTFLCGYGRGKFDRNTKGNFNPDCHLMFKIKTCDDLLQLSLQTKMVTVKEVVAEQRAKNPEAKIAYHSMFDIPSTDKDAFGVKLEHEVFFIPAFTSGEEGGQSQSITQNTLAGKLPANIFEKSHCVVATWSVKWSPLVLGPVRPLVLFKHSCDLPAGKAPSLM